MTETCFRKRENDIGCSNPGANPIDVMGQPGQVEFPHERLT
jgi:hypothetical protein